MHPFTPLETYIEQFSSERFILFPAFRHPYDEDDLTLITPMMLV